MFDQLFQPELLQTVLAAVQNGHAAAPAVESAIQQGPWWAQWIIWFPAGAALLCGLCAAAKVRGKAPALVTVIALGLSFVVTLALYSSYSAQPEGTHWNVHVFDWFNIAWGEGNDAGSFVANFSIYIDSLTLLWMLFVTGLGTLIAIYASEYMEADANGAGYARFFAGVSIFLFAMSCLVMGSNLVMLYLGWEGVGLASYLLIGYFYQKPSAVAAAKKAFIMNRIGDLGLALAIYFIWHNFGTVEYSELFAIFEEARNWVIQQHGEFNPIYLQGALVDLNYSITAGAWSITAIPFCLMLGAFGKSAQLPLYVWLPDAMEGPTPVSALIHAATMVTAGVYLLCRMFPLMELHPGALPTVAWVGGLTALLAATIAMAQYDIKRIMAYSTVSQLGYMFAGVGLMTTYGAAYHVFTHAFFKAVLFLTCGAIMHGFAGQLDLRKISGLRHMPGWGVTTWTMGYACLCLVGFPLISSGFYSKDTIMAEAFVTQGPGYMVLGVVLVLTALLTAYYTFRVFFRVCMGKLHFEMGEDHHGDDHGRDDGYGKPHAPRFAINGVLILISLGAIASIFLGEWAQHRIEDSSAAHGMPHGHHADAGFFADPHQWMMLVASITTIAGMGIALWLHLLNRKAADDLRTKLLARPATRWLPIAMEHKWYVDEVYIAIVRAPLWVLGHALWLFDQILIDRLIVDALFGGTPRWLGSLFRPLQSGVLHDYARSMAGATALVVLFVWLLSSGALDFLGGGAGSGVLP